MSLGVLILAAGNSTRIAAVSGGLPKPLLEIAGKPVIVHALEWLAESGAERVWVNLHHQAELVERALGDGAGWGLDISYSFESDLLGTAGAWKKLESEWSESSLVVYGDNLIRFDIAHFQRAHRRRSDALASIALFDPVRHLNTAVAGGRVALDDENRVIRFSEGGAPSEGDYVNAGVYLVEPELTRFIGDGFSDFGRDVFGPIAREGRIYGYVMEDEGFCLGLDTPECFAAAQDLVATQKVTLT